MNQIENMPEVVKNEIVQPNVIIEAVQDAYQQKIINLILGIQVDEFQIPITIEDQPDLLAIKEFYAGFWIARAGEDRIVGTIGLLDIGDNTGVIRKMFVDPEFRGKEKGISAALLSKLLSEAQSSGMEQIYLGTTAAFKAAHRFYEKHGFQAIPAKDLPPAFPRLEVDSKFYKLNFNQHV